MAANKEKKEGAGEGGPPVEVCDVAPEAAPNQDNPLPEYGDLFAKRQLKKATQPTYQDLMRKKKAYCKLKPLKDSCIPKEVLLPFREIPENAGGYSEFLGLAGKVKRYKGKINFPGWLISLGDDQLQSVLDTKELLSSGKPLCELIGPVFQAISGLGCDLTEEDIAEILRRVPSTSAGFSFSHFMFVAGNPWYAKKKGILQEPIPFSIDQCAAQDEEEAEEDGQQAGTSQSRANAKKGKSPKNVVDRLYQLPKLAEDDDWPPKEDRRASGDKSGKKEYSMNEQVFYSALLYCEMYETMEVIHNMYTAGGVPEDTGRLMRRQQQTGFGVADIGFKKLGFAEWDRPLPPLPKISPYISNLPIVGKRMNVFKPNANVAMYKRSRTSFDPLYVSVKAPSKPRLDAPITIMEDQRRIKAILDFLGGQGNCLALLPDVHHILHLSDSLLRKLEDVKQQKGPATKKRLPRSLELEMINHDAKELFRPHGLPKDIAKIPNLISFTDAVQLRDICKEIRDQHWAYICAQKLLFRDRVWKLMHVDRIPCGNLRESFVYSFSLYLPEKSHLPIQS